jgi:hypothetical protein
MDFNAVVKVQIVNHELWYNAVDIGVCTGHSNMAKAISAYNGDQKRTFEFLTDAGSRQCTAINLKGLMRFCTSSRLEAQKLMNLYNWAVDMQLNEISKLEEDNEQLMERNIKLEKSLDERDIMLQGIMHSPGNISGNDLVELGVHQRLIEAYCDTRVVYIGKIRDEEGGRILIKIGSSAGIVQRSAAHRSNFGNFTLLHVFPCDAHKMFEQKLHSHKSIEPHRYTGNIVDNVKSRETYLVTKEKLINIVNICKANVGLHRGAAVQAQRVQHTTSLEMATIQRQLATLTEKIDEITPKSRQAGTLCNVTTDLAEHDSEPVDTIMDAGHAKTADIADSSGTLDTATMTTSSSSSSDVLAMPPPAVLMPTIRLNPMQFDTQSFSSSSAPLGVDMNNPLSRARYARCPFTMNDEQAALVDKAKCIMSTEKANKFDLLCALSFISGRQLPELLKGTYEITGEPFKCRMGEGIVRDAGGFIFYVLLPTDLFIDQVARVRQMTTLGETATNREINLRYSNPANDRAKRYWNVSKFRELAVTWQNILSGGNAHRFVGKRKLDGKASESGDSKRSCS